MHLFMWDKEKSGQACSSHFVWERTSMGFYCNSFGPWIKWNWNYALVKRAIFINNSVEIREAFSFASPVEILSAIKIYCYSLYGFMLWALSGDGATRVFNAWTTCVKLTWEVPRGTRTYLVQQVLGSGLISGKVDILARFAGFLTSLRKSPSYEVAVLAKSGLDPWVYGSTRIKEELARAEIVEVAETDQWRTDYLRKLLEQRQILHYEGDKEGKEMLSDLIDCPLYQLIVLWWWCYQVGSTHKIQPFK